MSIHDWVYVTLFGCLVLATLFIPTHRWLGVLANALFYAAIVGVALVGENTGEPLGYWWSTLVVVLIPSVMSIHLFCWFLCSAKRTQNHS